MKYVLTFCSIQSDHILATPEEDYKEYVEVDSQEKLRKYIESKKDAWGNAFKKATKTTFGFQYISRAGGVSVESYKPKKFIKL